MRHGETEWSKSGRHTGRTDLPLTAVGRAEARQLGERLSLFHPVLVFTSPMRRAIDTCRLAGFGARAEIDERLVEWDYGDLEGLTFSGDHGAGTWLEAVRRRRPIGGVPERGRSASGLVPRFSGT